MFSYSVRAADLGALSSNSKPEIKWDEKLNMGANFGIDADIDIDDI